MDTVLSHFAAKEATFLNWVHYSCFQAFRHNILTKLHKNSKEWEHSAEYTVQQYAAV
jgi:hypothetical protein